MQIVKELVDIPTLPLPIGLTLGSFDGVHRGHRYLIDELRKRIGPRGTLALLTFSSHPSHTLKNRPPVQELSTQEEKLKLLEEAGVDLLILLSFTPKLAQVSYEDFLKEIKAHLPFSYLILGQGATFGHGKKGDETHVKALEKALSFKAEYLEKLIVDGQPVSSRRIREAIEQKDLKLAATLLGRNL